MNGISVFWGELNARLRHHIETIIIHLKLVHRAIVVLLIVGHHAPFLLLAKDEARKKVGGGKKLLIFPVEQP